MVAPTLAGTHASINILVACERFFTDIRGVLYARWIGGSLSTRFEKISQAPHG